MGSAAAPVRSKPPGPWPLGRECFKNVIFGRVQYLSCDFMPLQGLQKFEEKIERQLRFLEIRKHIIERKFERQIRLFEQKRDDIGKKIEERIKKFQLKRGLRLD